MENDNLKNIASERAVLSGLINHGQNALIDVELIVSENSFTLDYNKIIYKSLHKILQDNEFAGFTDILSSLKDLSLDKYCDDINFLKHIKGIIATPVHLDNVSDHAKKLKRLEFARTLQSELRTIYKNINTVTGDENISSILAIAEKPIQDICLSYMKEDDLSPKVIGDNLNDYITNLENNKGKSIGIPTGFASFDKAIGGGLRRKCVDLIAARPKVGKSVLADNVALYVTKTYNIPVLMLDTEMSKEDHWNRLIANISGVEINSIANGSFYFQEELQDKVLAAVENIKNLPYYYISIAGRPFEETLSIAKRWLLKNVGYDENGVLNDCLIVYDYLKLMTSSSINNNLAEFQVLGFQITQLHNFCVENDCPCLSFVQLNRDGITKETTDVVSGSDRLIWLCTSFSIFKDKNEEEKAADGIQNGNKKLIPIVSRHGPGIEDQGYICLNMDGGVSRLNEIGTIREIHKNASSQQQGFSEKEPDDIEDEVDGEDF